MSIATAYRLPDNDLLLVDGNLSLSLSGSNSGKNYILPLRIKERLESDKPREKMLAHGAPALSLAELLSVILVTGTKKEELGTMTHRIIKEYGEKSLFDHKNPQTMSWELDIPITKALQIVAIGELHRRFNDKKGVATIRNARDVYEFTISMRNLPKEHLRGIYLNSQHKVIHDETISVGTLNSSIVHPREVFRPALEYNAAAVILVHNHPSGDPTPSNVDIEITKQLVSVGHILGIALIDHVIVTADAFVSIDISYE